MRPFELARLSDLDAIPVADGLVWHPVRRRFGIRAFGLNAYTAESVGGHVVERHTERGNMHEEVYFVAAGRARFTVAGEEFDAPAGTFVYLPDPEVEREAIAQEEGTTVVAIGGKPGEAYAVSAWESWFAAIPHTRAGDHGRAAELMAADLAELGEHPGLLYNLACAEALAGRDDDALDHLRRAIELRGEFAEHARRDDDFASLRADPRFAAVVGSETVG